MPLFEVAMIEVPHKVGSGAAEYQVKERLVMGPKAVVAKDAQMAVLAAAQESSSLLANVDMDYVQVYVRPFA